MQPHEEPQVEYADGDYGYDEAHDAISGHVAAPPVQPHFTPPPPRDSGGDSGGDYGYDEAHDLRS